MSLLSDLNDKIKRLSTRVAEEFKTQQSAIDSKVSTVNGIAPDENGNVEVATGSSAAALPLGWEYTRLVSDSAPKGGADYLGQEATREFYADLWEYVNTEHPGRIISEDDWQAMYAAQNGNVPYFSTGDGSTTFRFPRVVSYLRAGDTAGQYTAEGLPNIIGRIDAVSGSSQHQFFADQVSAVSGAFSLGTFGGRAGFEGSGTGWGYESLGFDASLSSSVYGNSDHVTPETITVVMGVIAFGEIRITGTVTGEGILAEMQTYVKKSGDTMTGNLVVAEHIGFSNGARLWVA